MDAIIIETMLGCIGTVVWWLLRDKDAKQAEQIRLLFEKHDQDVKELAELRLNVASKHYEKSELDMRFKELEATFKEGFKGLGDKFDDLSQILIRCNRS